MQIVVIVIAKIMLLEELVIDVKLTTLDIQTAKVCSFHIKAFKIRIFFSTSIVNIFYLIYVPTQHEFVR